MSEPLTAEERAKIQRIWSTDEILSRYEATVKQAEQERDAARKDATDYAYNVDQFRKQAESAERQLEQARAALRKYGTHLPECQALITGKCTCGWERILKPEEARSES